MKPIRINLTNDQIIQLEPAFKKLHEVSSKGELGAILAQIYPDGMLVLTISGNSAKKLADTIGLNPEKNSAATLAERLSNA